VGVTWAIRGAHAEAANEQKAAAATAQLLNMYFLLVITSLKENGIDIRQRQIALVNPICRSLKACRRTDIARCFYSSWRRIEIQKLPNRVNLAPQLGRKS
jgi:hypothetical protein